MDKRFKIDYKKVFNLQKEGKYPVQIAKEVKCGVHSIYYIFRKYGIPVPKNGDFLRKKVNDKFFNKIDSEIKAYWLGFLMADGCIVSKSKGQKSLQLALKASDINHLEKFKKDIDSESIIHTYFIKRYNVYATRIFITSDVLCNDLIKLGCTERKSLTLKFPKLFKKYISHFIRGYFDGDGSVFTFNDKHWRSGKISKIIQCNFVSTKEFLTSICKELDFIKFDKDPVKAIKDNKAFSMSFKRIERVSNFYKYLYKNHTVCLERKKSIFDKYFKEKGSETIINNPVKD